MIVRPAGEVDRRRLLEGGTAVLAASLGFAARPAFCATGSEETNKLPGPSSGPEPAIDPDLPIIDAHHHLYDDVGSERAPFKRYLLPEFLSDIATGGHRITHTVFVQHSRSAMYRSDGPEALRPVGETEFANGIGAIGASGRYGSTRVAAALVAWADLRLGSEVRRVLEAHVAAGNGRTRGVRFQNAWADASIYGNSPGDRSQALIFRDPKVREAVAQLAPLGLSLDSWCFHPQIGELTSLASAFPGTTFVLNHLGTPLRLGSYRDKPREAFIEWRQLLRDLALRPNVFVKLGGLGMVLDAPKGSVPKNLGSDVLEKAWGPYIETAVEIFGAQRCMFESNFPNDGATCSYGVLWNTFKRIARQYSLEERTALFSGSAAKVYRL